MKNSSIFAVALSIVLGFSSLGYFINKSVVTMKGMERTVVVKGLAEREVMANEVVWPISFTLLGNSLDEIYAKNEEATASVLDFLTQNGISKDDITVLIPTIEDKSIYASQNNKPLYNFMAYANIVVSSSNVQAVSSTTEKTADLVKQGIALNGNSGSLQYTFTQLNELKPFMIEDATKNAREVAERFAKDSQSFLGKIRKANQGQFSIETPDRFKPEIKRVRVVSTVEYYLVD